MEQNVSIAYELILISIRISTEEFNELYFLDPDVILKVTSRIDKLLGN